jgi:phytoene desaturase
MQVAQAPADIVNNSRKKVSPSNSSEKKAAIVIGSGLGGIAAAIRLQARGYSVILLEARDKPGGRAYVYEQDGFIFDAGPTIITAPFLIDELFALSGRRTEDYVKIVPCDPFYRIAFHDGTSFDYSGDENRMIEQILKFSTNDVEGYKKFVSKTEKIFRRAFLDLADKPFSSIADMLVVAPDLIALKSHESVYRMVSDYISDEKLRIVFSFHPLLVGGNPFSSSSIYAMIHYLERKWGVHFALGGTGALVRGLVRAFLEMGGRLELNSRVTKILITDRKAHGVIDEHGREFRADVIVSNADVANTYRKLVAPAARRKWSDKKLEKMRYSMSLFLIYFGTNRNYPQLAHHTIVLGPRYKGLLDDIFDKKILARDFSLYLHAPTRTDPRLAPRGCECFYVLSPVPHLGGKIDWNAEKERYADAILESLETLCPNLRRHVVTKRIFTPLDFESQLDAYLGSAFQFEPVLTQSAWFRPHNVSEDVKNLYLVGAGTHPGAGIPGVLSSAKLLDRVIPAPKDN